MSIWKENELPEDFMIRMGMYFSSTVREDYFRVAGEITVLRTRLAALEASHNALKDAVCKVVEMHRKGEGHVCTHYPSGRRALDALAALVGEEGK